LGGRREPGYPLDDVLCATCAKQRGLPPEYIVHSFDKPDHRR